MSILNTWKLQIKAALDLIMRLITCPVYLLYVILEKIIGSQKAFGSVMQTVSLFPGVLGEWFRRGVLQWLTSNGLRDCCIGFGSTFSDPRLVVGDGVYIGPRCDIGFAEIGKDSILGSGVHVLSGQNQHYFKRLDIPIRDQGGAFVKVSIGEGTWIGNGAIIAANVGKGCVVGAGSVVITQIEDYAIAVGNPAKVIRSRKESDNEA